MTPAMFPFGIATVWVTASFDSNFKKTCLCAISAAEFHIVSCSGLRWQHYRRSLRDSYHPCGLLSALPLSLWVSGFFGKWDFVQRLLRQPEGKLIHLLRHWPIMTCRLSCVTHFQWIIPWMFYKPHGDIGWHTDHEYNIFWDSHPAHATLRLAIFNSVLWKRSHASCSYGCTLSLPLRICTRNVSQDKSCRRIGIFYFYFFKQKGMSENRSVSYRVGHDNIGIILMFKNNDNDNDNIPTC